MQAPASLGLEGRTLIRADPARIGPDGTMMAQGRPSKPINEFAMTVLGPVDPANLGVTLVHEHLHMDATPLLATHGYLGQTEIPFERVAADARWNPGIHPDNYRLTDADLVLAELAPLQDTGVTTIVDVTPVELGRNPIALGRIAEGSGLRVVMGGGHYIHGVHAAALDMQDEDAIANRLLGEWRDGVDGTGIRPGIIGEIGASDPLHACEARVLRAAARVGAATGLAVSVHLEPWKAGGDAVLDVVLAESLPAERVVLGHLTTAHADQAYLMRLLDRGAMLAFDLFGFDHSLLGSGRYPPSDADVAATVIRLVRAGYGDRVLVSQDVGVKTRLLRFGGWGYGHLLKHVVPLLREAGMPEVDIERLLVGNPRRLLTIKTPP
jgi:phosphotriesterase-related protein